MGSFQSTCLMVDEVTSPSYNYDYNFKDYSKNSESEISAAATAEASFSASIISGEASSSASVDTKSTSQMRMITASMKIQRYYSSVREELSPLSEDALTLLDSQDYIGFFKSCGPNYVRSIRRAQELTAIFKFSASSTSVATEFAASIKGEGAGRSISTKVSGNSKFSSAKSSLKIIILGFGLGLNNEGSSTLVSTSLEEYNEVMKFAFKSFTQNEDSHNIGMVYGFELVPWVDNTSFQVNSKLMDEEVIIPLPRSMIPKATQQKEDDTEADVVWTNDEDTRAIYACKNAPFNMDKYGYCCESNLLWNPLLQEHSPELQNVTVSERFCRPASKLDKSVVKNNMSNNGEFVAHLDSLVRMKINNLFTLERCISMIRTFPVTNDYNLLKHQDSVEVAGILEMDFTVKEMRLALDPLNNFSLPRAVGEELDEWVDMYYQPCVAALFGMNVGSNPDVESQYFLAYGWLSHSACMRLSCLADNMRWDRKASGGGCTTSLLVGYYAENYQSKDSNGDADALCKKDNSNMVEQSGEACKYDQEYLFKVQSAHNHCFACGVSPAFILNEFCMPQLTEEIAFGAKREDVDSLSELCPYHEVGAAAWDPGAAALPVIACHTGESDEDLGIGGF